MTESFRLGRIAGVPVGVNWSVLVILGLIAVVLAGGRLPVAAPDRPVGVYALVGVAAALAFLASLLAHEVSHALVAQRNGVGVEGITLWLFGGVARLRGEPDSPGADLRIAGVGPLVSLVLGALFLGAAALAAVAGAGPLALEALTWLGFINLVLAVFNLAPAAPLDGGRVLRAAVWRWTGDRNRAARAATRAGRVFGFVLIALGLAQFLLARGIGGLWLALIGWFIVAAAGAEEAQVGQNRMLAGIRVGEVMTPDPFTAAPEKSVQAFIDEDLMKHRFSTLPLVDEGGSLVGLVTLNRVRQVPANERASTSLRDVACAPADLPVAAADEELIELLPRMQGCSDGRAMVLDAQRRLLGIVSPSDVARAVQAAELRHPHATRVA